MVTGKTALDRAQRRWADARGVRYDARGCVRDLAANFRIALSAAALAELERGSELAPRGRQAARLWSLCSSAALVVNVFEHWRGRDATPLLATLGVAGLGDVELRFEEPVPTGLTGDPPSLDVVLDRSDGVRVAIESKYREWLVPRPRAKRVFKDKYFPAGGEIWADAGLPRCQRLAEDLQAGRERYKYLHAAQLLKHALGLARAARPSVLVYLYYDAPCREAAVHRSELARVGERLAAEIDLRAQSYQALFASLRGCPEVGDDYVDYLAERYFPEFRRDLSPGRTQGVAAALARPETRV